jgi:molybdate transport system ATP-binding protein
VTGSAALLDVAIEKRLGDFSLDIAFAGQPGITALFGPSGSGKSSIVNALAGLLTPDRGHIAIGEDRLFDAKARLNVRPWRRRVGYVFQDSRLFPHLSVRSNLLYGRWFTPAAERQIELAQIVELLGLASLIDRRPATLSGGERQRVAIGRALLASPRLLLMDEPLASLDEARKLEILTAIERLRDRLGLPIVYVSHALDEVTRLADTIVALDQGRVTAFGSVAEMTSRLDLPGLVARDDAGAVLDVTVAEHDTQYGMTGLSFAGGRLKVPALDLNPGARLRVAIRARDVAVALSRPTGLSVQNILAGTIAEIGRPRGSSVDLLVEVGASRLIARITMQSRDELSLEPGRSVFLLIKSLAFAGRGRDRVVD